MNMISISRACKISKFSIIENTNKHITTNSFLIYCNSFLAAAAASSSQQYFRISHSRKYKYVDHRRDHMLLHLQVQAIFSLVSNSATISLPQTTPPPSSPPPPSPPTISPPSSIQTPAPEKHPPQAPNWKHISSAHPACAIVDFQMGWTKNIFWKFKIPVISFFTFGACAAAMEWGAWKSGAGGVNPGEVLLIPGLPAEMQLTYHDFVRKPRQQSPLSGGGGGGPPRPGERPPWVPLVEGSVALMFNTCDDLERPFIKYLATEMGLPVFGVGPLLPNQFCASSNSMVHDVLIRQPKHQSNYSEAQILQWLNKNPEKSVLYVSFGSEVSLTVEESMQLASALQEMPYPFIWVTRNISNDKSLNIHPIDLANNAVSNIAIRDVKEERNEWDFLEELSVGSRGRGLIISGWAPQLLILSHPSTGGFVSHCGWNSTLEAMARGVPILAWPIRGDQIYNAKLVVNHLEVGHMAWPNGSMDRVKDDLRRGMEWLMTDRVVRNQAEKCRGILMSSNVAILDGLRDFM